MGALWAPWAPMGPHGGPQGVSPIIPLFPFRVNRLTITLPYWVRKVWGAKHPRVTNGSGDLMSVTMHGLHRSAVAYYQPSANHHQ